MKYFKHVLVLVLISTLVGCGGGKSKRPTDEERKDREAARLNVQLAAGYIRRGNLEVAKDKLEKAIEFDDRYVPAYTTMAVLMNMIGKPDEAEDYYSDALDINPNDPELRNNYGTFLCGIGKIDKAIEQFNTAIRNQFYETPHVAHGNLGYCLMQSEKPDYKLAEKHLRKALATDPNLASALLAMGELGIHTGKYLMTRAYMQRYHAVARPTSHSMWIQIQAEYALGDREYFLKLSKQLLKAFPESKEAEKVMRLSNR